MTKHHEHHAKSKFPSIIVYTKTGCGWGIEVIEFLEENKIPFEERDMYENDEYRLEAIKKTGQWKCPTLDIDGHMLKNSDAEEVEEYLISIGVLAK